MAKKRRQKGFLYILSNDAYSPGLYKIGKTKRHPQERAEELGDASGVPVPFRVLFYCQAADIHQAEKTVHSWLTQFRVNKRREFFYIDFDYACHCVWQACF